MDVISELEAPQLFVAGKINGELIQGGHGCNGHSGYFTQDC